jgi:AcrR family transcriptional regulator
MKSTFQRARSEEQRSERRQAILDTAAAMLTELPVAEVSLNELSRRVGLAKSNVLRYFESREAVLLNLLDSAAREWLAQLDGTLADAVEAGATAYERADQTAAALAGSVAAHPVLCDLISAQAAVLEHNVSVQVAAGYKRAAMADVDVLAELVRGHLPELSEHDAVRFAAAAIMVTGAVWAHTQPSAAMKAAYAADPSLAAMKLDFADALRQMLQMLLSGLLARSPTSPPA